MQDYKSNYPSPIEQSEVSNMNLEKDSLEGEEDTSCGLARRLIQEMQRKADVISVLQQELTQDIQAFRLNHLKKYDTKGDTTSNILAEKMTSSTTAAGTDHQGSEMHQRLSYNRSETFKSNFQLVQSIFS